MERKVKLSLFSDGVILYIRILRMSPKKLLGIINEFGKVSDYKINIHKSDAFLYTDSELSEKEIKKIILLTITSKRIKYLGINLTKEVKICLCSQGQQKQK